jgi:hypothetical protein
VSREGPKARLFSVTERTPLARETADPWIFLLLTGLVVVAGLAVAFPGEVFPEDEDARSHVIQLAAGMLVILGAWFTAVNIREVRAHQAFERLQKVIEQLGDGDEAVRIGAIRLLQSIALEKLDLPGGSTGQALVARRKAVGDALAAVAAEDGGRPSAALAEQVLRELEASGALP